MTGIKPRFPAVLQQEKKTVMHHTTGVLNEISAKVQMKKKNKFCFDKLKNQVPLIQNLTYRITKMAFQKGENKIQ